MKRELAGLVTIGAVNGIGIFTSIMPDRSEIVREKPTPELLHDMRNGELVASALTLGLSALIAFIVRDMSPIYIGLGTVVVMVALYEYVMLRGRR